MLSRNVHKGAKDASRLGEPKEQKMPPGWENQKRKTGTLKLEAVRQKSTVRQRLRLSPDGASVTNKV
jgi:hypothetical protein